MVVVPLTQNKVLCLGQKRTDLFSRRTGALLDSSGDIEARKIKFLMKQSDDRDIVVATKVTETTNVYIVRPMTKKPADEKPEANTELHNML